MTDRARFQPGLWPRRGLMALVRGYRLLLSPWLGASCRFEPTCSQYALQVLERHGAVAGSALTLYRLARCQPWCQGGYDAAPEHLPRGLGMFTQLLSPSSPPAPTPADPITSSKKPS
jgi:putative membrane protein insertion efficiency factor